MRSVALALYIGVVASGITAAQAAKPVGTKAAAGPKAIVTFPDANLEAVVRAALGIPTGDINDTDMAGLTSLNGHSSGITNLAGLEYAVSLQYLTLYSNSIGDVSPLSGLTSLVDIHLAANNISDVSPLSGLTNLTDLVLNANNISDVSPLSGLTGLSQLLLENNNISDVSPLSGLTNLSTLWLSGNAVRDVSALSGMTNLTQLLLGINDICDISALVANSGLGAGDSIFVQSNPLSQGAYCTDIPTLQARGATVHSSGTCNGGFSLGEVEPLEMSHDFGTWDVGAGATPPWTLTVANTGSETLTVFGIALVGPQAAEFAILSGTGECYIRPGEAIYIEVAFDPSAAAACSATLRFTCDDQDEATVDIALAGVGDGTPLPAVSSVAQTFLLVMIGGLALFYASRRTGLSS